MSFVISPGVIQTPLTAGGVAYGTGTQAKMSAAGTSGLPLLSAGAGVPTFSALGAAGGGTGLTSPGTSGNVLTSNGTAWTSSPLASSSALVYLSSATASNSATVDLETGIGATYDNYLIVYNNVRVTSAGSHLFCRLKIGGSYQTSSNYGYSAVLNNNTLAAVSQANANDNNIRLSDVANGLDSASDRTSQGQILLCNVNSTTTYKLINWQIGWVNTLTTPGLVVSSGVGGFFNSTSALTGIRFRAQSGNIEAGTFRLYGIVNS